MCPFCDVTSLMQKGMDGLGEFIDGLGQPLTGRCAKNLRRLVRRILRKHGYPPDKQEKATLTVLEQAEVLSEGWAD